MSIEERTIEVVRQVSCGGVPSTINKATPLKDLQWDSLDFSEAILELEEEFDINISDDEAEVWKTIGDIVAFVERNMID